MREDGVTPSRNLVDAKIFEYHIHECINRLTNMKNVLKAKYSLEWEKCSKSMKRKLQYLPGFDQARDDYAVIALIKLIQGATFNFKKHT